jgi:hypothetical protein
LKWPNREFSKAEEGKSEMAKTQRAHGGELCVPELTHHWNTLPPDGQDEDFQPVAQLLTPNPPEWLNEYLHFLFYCVRRDLALDQEKPTRAQLLQMLTEVLDAVDLLIRFLVRGDLISFLGSEECPISLPRIMFLQMNLKDIRDRASRARQSPELAGEDGKARPGRGTRLCDKEPINAK